MRYTDWKEEVAAECREVFQQDVDELRLSESVMKNYWHEGYSPQEYVRDMADSHHQEIEEEQAFDIRYDL